MLQADVPPSRIERAKHKILDVIAGRAGGRTALIAYAGSAHGVVPLTEDPEVLKPFVEGLSPKIKPTKGQNATAALALARAALADEETPGAILFVLDDLDRADLTAFEAMTAEPGMPMLDNVNSTMNAAMTGSFRARPLNLAISRVWYRS